MNTKTITTLSIIAIILIAFITNPSKQKHVDKSVEVLFHDDNDLGILSGMVDTFYKPTIAPKVKIDNYYIFSVSYVRSKNKNKRMNIGLGLFGQVLSIASGDDVNRFNNTDTTKEKKQKKSTEQEIEKTKDVDKAIDNLIGGNHSKQSKNPYDKSQDDN